MIYRVSGLDEPPLDVSPTPTRLAICQCRLQYTEPYVGSWVPYTEAKTLPCHNRTTFSSLCIRRILCVITYKGSTGGFFHRVICPCSIYCRYGVKLLASWTMNRVTICEDSDTVTFSMTPFKSAASVKIMLFLFCISGTGV